ncbi:MAG TPA: TlpA disulfide reductase family protein [Kofleriaceae bacterium]|nr:TlpA disulfide reductase family protein [Kofleriaceae bacterium]
MKSLLFLLALTGVAQAELKTGDHFVELDAKTAKGKHFRLKDMAGKWVLYTFGASWCGPCRKELPAWDKVAPKLGGKVLFVAVNINTDIQEGREFVSSLKLRHIFPVFLPDEDSPALKAYDPSHMPSTFVIDPEGRIRIIRYGYRDGDEDKLVAELQELIKK